MKKSAVVCAALINALCTDIVAHVNLSYLIVIYIFTSRTETGVELDRAVLGLLEPFEEVVPAIGVILRLDHRGEGVPHQHSRVCFGLHVDEIGRTMTIRVTIAVVRAFDDGGVSFGQRNVQLGKRKIDRKTRVREDAVYFVLLDHPSVHVHVVLLSVHLSVHLFGPLSLLS